MCCLSKKCNEILHQHYADESMAINHDIEYNDGCASQFKCIRAISTLARRNAKTTCVFCETSHGKSKSDGMLVWQSHLHHVLSVGSTRSSEMQRNELTDFINEELVVKSAYESHKPMLNQLFFCISSDEMENYRNKISSLELC